MKINFSETIKDLRNQVIKDPTGAEVTIGQAVAQTMWQDTKHSPKFYEWAPKLFNSGIIDVDTADKKLLEDWIGQSELSNAVKGPALGILAITK